MPLNNAVTIVTSLCFLLLAQNCYLQTAHKQCVRHFFLCKLDSMLLMIHILCGHVQ